MLTPPDLTDAVIAASLREHYGLSVTRIDFLPIGADANSAVYRVAAGESYFLKLRRGDFDPVAVAVPAFLRAQGIEAVMAPLADLDGQLSVRAHDFDWMLYPFVEGHDGFEVELSNAQWFVLGRSLRRIHTTALPPDLARRVLSETYAPHLRAAVLAFDAQIDAAAPADPIVARLAAFWLTRRAQIRTLVDDAARLAEALKGGTAQSVLCHSDIHGGNVLVSSGGALFIVDWDNPILAPKERDLMFVGNGIGLGWRGADDAEWFYRGYGPTELDPVALAYYRHERIVADIAAYGEQLFGVQGSIADREQGLRQLISQFAPGDVVEIAHQTYARLPGGHLGHKGDTW